MTERASSRAWRGWREAALVMACATTLGTLMAAPRAVSAQAKMTPEVQQQVVALLREGKAAFDKGDHAGALKAFEAAYKLYPAPPLLYRMGEASEKLGKVRQAVGYYEAFVKAAPEDDVARKVALELPKLKAKVPAIVRITTDPSNANVYIDSVASKPIGSTPFEQEFAPGKRLLIVKLDGYEPYTKEFTFEGSEEETLNVRLVPLPVGQRPVTTPVAGGGSGKKILGWTTTGVGVAGLAAGGVFTLLKSQKTDEVNSYNKRAPGATAAGLDDLKDQANAHHQRSVIAFIAGGAVTAAGVGLLVWAYSSEAPRGEKQTEVSGVQLNVSAAPGAAFLGLSGSF